MNNIGLKRRGVERGTPDAAAVDYSYLNDCIGSRAAALLAGHTPKRIPTKPEKRNASRMDDGATEVLKFPNFDNANAAPQPNKIPPAPPRRHSTTASMRN
jgi:hypothetical protein